MLKDSPWKGVVRFGKRGKLNPRYVSPFKVIEIIRTVAYKLELPHQLSRVHSTFHVSNLKKCLSDESLVIPLEELRVDDKLHFVEEPVEVIDHEIKQLKRRRIPIVKVKWNSKRGPEFAMSSDNASSTVTYMSVSSDSNEPSSWGIPLVNAGEIPELDPYEEVAQQGQAHPLSHAYVPDPMELDEHVLVYVPEPEHPEYHAPSDADIQVEDQPNANDASPTAESLRYIDDSDMIKEDTNEDSIDYPDEPEDGEEDDDEDPEEDPSEEHEPEDDDDDDDTDDEDEEPTEDEEEEEHLALADSSVVPVVDPVPSAGDTKAFETDESAPTPRSPQTRVPFSQTRLCRARKTVRLEPPMSASMEARIAEHAAAPIPPTNPTYDQAPLGHRAAMIRMRDDIPEEDMPPRRRFVLTAPPPGCNVAESSVVAARAPRAADRAEDVGYVRALQTSEHRMITSIEEVNLRVSYQAQRTTYETKLHEVRQAYLSSEAWNRALLAPLKTLETHISRMEWQRQRAEDDAVKQIMRTQVLEARARIDTVEDAGTYTQRFQELALMCTKFLADETTKIDKYIGGLLDNIHGNVMSARPKSLDFAIELANDLMDQKLRTNAERQNENKRKADDSSRNNHQQQPHKKQNVARAYTAGLGEKKAYTRDLPLCTKCNYHHTGQCAPKCGKCKRYGHATTDCRVNTNNNNKNQKVGACYECGNTGHMRRDCSKLKNHGNGNGNGTAQGRAYALGGRDASPDSNVINGYVSSQQPL
ncbi:putative reverse transcriptase domain-containing protein [Tanacetum coccineum]